MDHSKGQNKANTEKLAQLLDDDLLELFNKKKRAENAKKSEPEYIVLDSSSEDEEPTIVAKKPTEVATSKPQETVRPKSPEIPEASIEPVEIVLAKQNAPEPLVQEVPTKESCSQGSNAQNISSFDEEDDLPLNKLIEKTKTNNEKKSPSHGYTTDDDNFGEESEEEEISSKIKNDWCVCDKFSVFKDYTKMCDGCNQWYHIDCVCDEETKKKLKNQRLDKIEFNCMICRNDQELIKKIFQTNRNQTTKAAAKKQQNLTGGFVSERLFVSGRRAEKNFLKKYKSLEEELEDDMALMDYAEDFDSDDVFEKEKEETARKAKSPLLVKNTKVSKILEEKK